jgi:hypothetical protein
MSFLSDRMPPFTQFHSDLSRSAVHSTEREDDLIYHHIYVVLVHSLAPVRLYYVFPNFNCILSLFQFSNASFENCKQLVIIFTDFQSVKLNKFHYCLKFGLAHVIPMRGTPPKIPLILSNLRAFEGGDVC